MSETLTGTKVNGWNVGAPGPVKQNGNWVTAYRCGKVCRECKKEWHMNFTHKALTGESPNAGIQLARCLPCRKRRKASGLYSQDLDTADEIKTVETSAPVVADQPQDLASQMYRDNVALLREIAELKAALALAERVASAPSLAAQTTTPGADTAELEELRRFRLDVFGASQCFEYGPTYVNAAGSKTRDRLGPEQVTNATLLAHVKEVGKLYIGAWRIFSGFEDVQVALNNVAYGQAYISAASLTLDNSAHNRISSEARDEADAKYPLD